MVYVAHGPPDLLEVNMTEHSQNSPSSFSEDHNLGSPEASMVEDDECCIKTEPNEESGAGAFQGIVLCPPVTSLYCRRRPFDLH